MNEISFLQRGQRVKLLPLEICEQMEVSDTIGINGDMERRFGGYVTISRKFTNGRFCIMEDGCTWSWISAWIDVGASFPDLFVTKKQEV